LKTKGIYFLYRQLALLLGQVLRGFDQDLHVHVAALPGAQHRHALAGKPEALAGLRTAGDLHPGLTAVDGRHFELAAHRRRHHGHRHPAMQVGAFALEEWVGADRQEDIEIAWRAAAHAGFAFAGEANAGAVFDAGRDVDRQGPLARDPARA